MRTSRIRVISALAALFGIFGSSSLAAGAEAIDAVGSGAATPVANPASATGEDPFLWLEEVDGDKALDWVRARNAETEARLRAYADFDTFYRDALATLNAPSRIPVVQYKGKHLYNFWKDEQHPRGIYRRTTLEGLRKQPPQWELVLDVDALAKSEGKPWVFHGMPCLPPEHRHCLVNLSPGGGDANEVREFDATTLSFVKNGFFLPTAKSQTSWVDADQIYVGTDFGDGSLTRSGYPRVAKLWKRGTPLSDAKTIYTGNVDSMSAGARRIHTNNSHLDAVYERATFWTEKNLLIDGDKLVPLDVPETADIDGASRGLLVISLKEDWTTGGRTLKAGTVVVADPKNLTNGKQEVSVLFEPTTNDVVASVHPTERGILVTRLDNVRGRIDVFEPSSAGGWTRRNIAFPDNGALEVTTADDDTGSFFAMFESFTTPPTLYFVAAPDWKPEPIFAQEPSFDGSPYSVEQHWATSKDGTKIPYFTVARTDLALDGKNPTHIFSYGGFRSALVPSYSGSYEPLNGAYGKLWLQRGGVFVLANIRGGGEFGPAWHAAALRENRPRAFEDFEAIAEDLAKRKITSARHIGIEGRSNGGLLVGATFIRRPELYGAVICGSPLSDMRRYHKLLAGASWVAEFGDPDKPEDWAFIAKYSPYQNLRKGQPYPAVMFYTSTRDDRVHPGHARKMAARMLEMGYPIEYYENIEGGHGGNVTNEQLALRLALVYAHLWSHLR